MPKRIYVGNLPFSASDDEIRTLVGRYGKVVSVKIESSGRERTAVVEMASDGEASRALAGLDGSRLGGQALNVNEARPRP